MAFELPWGTGGRLRGRCSPLAPPVGRAWHGALAPQECVGQVPASYRDSRAEKGGCGVQRQSCDWREQVLGTAACTAQRRERKAPNM